MLRENFLSLLKEASELGDVKALKKILKEAVTGFTPDDEIVDIVYQQRKN